MTMITVRLTDRAPVQCDTEHWPKIARVSEDSYRECDHARHEQARAQGEVDVYTMTVRQHRDGRTLVYATLDAAEAWIRNRDAYAGELLRTGEHVVACIRRVGLACGLPETTIRETIAALPATPLE